MSLKNIANPRHPAGGWALPHVAALAIIYKVVVFVLAVAFVASNAANWRSEVKAHLARDPHTVGGVARVMKREPQALPPVGGSALPAKAGIKMLYFTGTDDQGNTYTCAAHADAKGLSFAINLIHHYHIRVSSRLLYDDNTHGADLYTSPSDYPGIATRNGVVLAKHFDYGYQHNLGYYPFGTEYSPASLNRYRFRASSYLQVLYNYRSPGYGGVWQIEHTIAQGRPVIVLMDFYYRQDHYNGAYTGHMDLPNLWNDWVEFGHTMIAVRYNRNLWYQHVKGWVLFNNSFGPWWGVDKYGNWHPGKAGYVWVSERYLERYSYGAGRIRLSNPSKLQVTGGGHSAVRNQVYAPPYDPGYAAGSGGYWVHNVHLDNNVNEMDLSKTINDAAVWAGISPVGLAAVLGTESNFREYAPHYPIPGAGGCDYSAGISQFTVCTIATARPYPVGDGSLSYGNITYVMNWENTHPIQMIWNAAGLLGSYKSIACVDFPALYVAWNAGPYAAPCGSYWWFNPTGMAGSNYQGFLGWWNYSQANFSTSTRAGYVAPKPWSFPVAWFETYVRHHHQHDVPYRYKKGYGRVPLYWARTVGVAKKLGPVRAKEQWLWKLRVMKQRFLYGTIYSWPTKRSDPVKVALGRSS